MNGIKNPRFNRRHGLTRVDVVICLFVVVLAMSVIAPGLTRRRGPPRRLECLNNMRNVGLSIQNYASIAGGLVPPLTSEMKPLKESGEEGMLVASYPIVLLPALDSTYLLKKIKRNAVPKTDQPDVATMTLADSEKIWLPFFTCPDDANAFRKPGRMSYVINTGFIRSDFYHGDPRGLHRLGQISWNENETLDEDVDVDVSAATGVTWRHHERIQPSLDYIATGDGASSTILLTENLQAGHWYDTDTATIAFGLPVDTRNGQVAFGPGMVFESVERPLNTEFKGGNLLADSTQRWQINVDRNAERGTRPRPSSNHKGGVNAMFCDGSGRYLSDNIDPHVYVRLLTSNGITHGEPVLKERSY